jgi:hypothetical protein
MKKYLLLLAILFLANTQTKAQYSGDWKNIKNENSVAFYTNTRCYDNCSYKLYFVRLINNSSTTKKEVNFTNVEFYDNGVLIKSVNGAGVTLRPSEDRYGENSGLWFNIPKGYENKFITIRLIGITVKDAL